LLIEMLALGAVPITACIACAAELGISERTLRAARARLPIKAVRRPWQGGVAHWAVENVSHEKQQPPTWRPPKPPRLCVGCCEPMVAAHWHQRRCRRCKLAHNAAVAQQRYWSTTRHR
jgi:hypothetical protein